jgi:hypothetical protein
VSCIDHKRVGFDIDDLVCEIEQRVRIDRRHGGIDDLDRASRERALQPLLQHPGRRGHAAVREPGSGRSALDDHPDSILRLVLQEIPGVDADARRIVGVCEEPLDYRLVGLQVSLDRRGHEERDLLARAREAQHHLEDTEYQEGKEEGDDVEGSSPRALSGALTLSHIDPFLCFSPGRRIYGLPAFCYNRDPWTGRI